MTTVVTSISINFAWVIKLASRFEYLVLFSSLDRLECTYFCIFWKELSR